MRPAGFGRFALVIFIDILAFNCLHDVLAAGQELALCAHQGVADICPVLPSGGEQAPKQPNDKCESRQAAQNREIKPAGLMFAGLRCGLGRRKCRDCHYC